MKGRPALICTALGAAGLGLSGCAAALVAAPLAAGAGVYKSAQDSPNRSERRRARQQAPKPGQVLTAPDGHAVRLGSIAKVSIDPGQQQLTREDLAPFIAVTARLEGRDLGSGMRDVKATVDDRSLLLDRLTNALERWDPRPTTILERGPRQEGRSP